MNKKIRLLLISIGILSSLGGLGLMLPFVYFSHKSAASSVIMLPLQASLPAEPDLITGQPVSINIASLRINLPVAEGTYNEKNRSWTLYNDRAQFATPSVTPNNKQGNTFIYGHATDRVFGRLQAISLGSEVQLVTSNGYRFTYAYKSNKAVDPSNVDVLAYQGKPQLTIQTCSGTWSQYRQLYTFEFVRVEKVS